MPYTPLQAPAHLDTDGLRQHGEDQFREIERAWSDLEASLVSITQNSQSGAYTLVLADANKHILHPSTDNNPRLFTIPTNATVPYAIGTRLMFVNEINVVTIGCADTFILSPANTTTSPKTLAAGGVATALKIGATKWIIYGTGLT